MANYSNEKMTVGGVEVTVKTNGPEDEAERVHMHVIDEAAKAMQAMDQEQHPDECDGQMFTVNWDEVLDHD